MKCSQTLLNCVLMAIDSKFSIQKYLGQTRTFQNNKIHFLKRPNWAGYFALVHKISSLAVPNSSVVLMPVNLLELSVYLFTNTCTAKLSLSRRGDDRFCLHCGNSNPSTARPQDASFEMRFGSALMDKLGPQVIAFAAISARASERCRSWLMVPLTRSRAIGN